MAIANSPDHQTDIELTGSAENTGIAEKRVGIEEPDGNFAEKYLYLAEFDFAAPGANIPATETRNAGTKTDIQQFRRDLECLDRCCQLHSGRQRV